MATSRVPNPAGMSPAQQGGDTAVNEQNLGTGVESRNLWDYLEDFVRGHIQQFIQRLLVEEVTMRGAGRSRSGWSLWTRRRDTATGMATPGN